MPQQELSSEALGERLRLAREAAGCTQAAAAARIRVARTTLLAMEAGQRRARIGEVQKLARHYHTTANQLLRREAVHTNLLPRFQKHAAHHTQAAREAAERLVKLAQAEAELESVLGVSRARNTPPERPLLAGDVRVQAELGADELRRWLGLGVAPVHDLFALLELELGVRLYAWPLEASIAGAFAFDAQLGACVLTNARHSHARRAQTAAHALGYLVANRQHALVLLRAPEQNTRAERHAAAFARAFLMPARALANKFEELTAGAARATRHHVILLAHLFGVSNAALLRRLEELRLLKGQSLRGFEARSEAQPEQVREMLGAYAVAARAPATARGNTLSLRLKLLAGEAWRRELLSEGQLQQLLGLRRVELRALLDAVRELGSEADGAPKRAG